MRCARHANGQSPLSRRPGQSRNRPRVDGSNVINFDINGEALDDGTTGDEAMELLRSLRPSYWFRTIAAYGSGMIRQQSWRGVREDKSPAAWTVILRGKSRWLRGCDLFKNVPAEHYESLSKRGCRSNLISCELSHSRALFNTYPGQCSELAGDNRLVGGSSPPGPTTRKIDL